MSGAQWFGAIRFRREIAGEQIDQVKIGGVGQFTATHSPQREDDEFRARNLTMRCFEFGGHGFAHNPDRRFG